MSSKYKADDPFGVYFCTIPVHQWVDLFTRERYRQVLAYSLDYCQRQKGLRLYAYVIMTNHLHLICQARSNTEGLPTLMRDFKKYTASMLLREIDESGESRAEWLRALLTTRKNNGRRLVWQPGYHPVQIFNKEVFRQKVEYMHRNPVRAGFVSEETHWRWSSASDYAQSPGLVNVEVVPY